MLTPPDDAVLRPMAATGTTMSSMRQSIRDQSMKAQTEIHIKAVSLRSSVALPTANYANTERVPRLYFHD
jgi:hypothetical protein